MPQFMQRAAWSRVSFSLKGTTNSRKLLMRSATGSYLRSCRSISRKPVILPIKPEAPEALLCLFPSFRDAPKAQTRNPDVILRDSGFALCAPRNDAFSFPSSLRCALLRVSKDDLVTFHRPSRPSLD